MGLIQEFREFAVKGNALELAVGVIIGAAFGGVVNSLVKDVLMPPLGVLTGGMDFSYLRVVMLEKVVNDAGMVVRPESALSYGVFINTVINFLIVAAAVFAVVKAINTMRRREAAAPSAPPAPTRQELLLAEIRDALRDRA